MFADLEIEPVSIEPNIGGAPSDYRDLVIEELADAEARLREDVGRYRLVAVEAIHALHEQRAELESLRAQHHHLIDEFRAVRGSIVRKDGGLYPTPRTSVPRDLVPLVRKHAAHLKALAVYRGPEPTR